MGLIVKLLTGNPMFILWGALALAVASASGGGYLVWKVQSARLDSVKQDLAIEKAEFASFVKQVNTAGIAAKAKADAENKLNLERKVKSDREYKKLLAANSVLNKRLRDNASRSVLPEAPANSRSPEYACFSRAELDRALQRFIGGTAELVVEGTESTLALDSVKRWAQR